MGSSKGLLLLLGLCLASKAQAAASNVIRGAQPDQIEKYQPADGKFTCFDGSKTIDFNQVNDNFCDCPDSSDEPGA
jgi:protein kinase C substrate 80K-H